MVRTRTREHRRNDLLSLNRKGFFDSSLKASRVTMIAVIFEVFPAEGRKDDYLEYAARLKSELECMDGFISVERFQSLTDPDKLLSLSFWRDEEAVAGWRARAGHRVAQSAGRKGIFRDYRLRVAAVVRDYGMSERREQARADSRAIFDVFGLTLEGPTQ
jgi:heme-degrading monooxygenase HmoA